MSIINTGYTIKAIQKGGESFIPKIKGNIIAKIVFKIDAPKTHILIISLNNSFIVRNFKLMLGKYNTYFLIPKH